MMQQPQHWQRHLALAQIGAERFASRAFTSRQINAIIVNLIGGAEMPSEVCQRFDLRREGIVQFRAKFGRNRKQSCGFQFNDSKIFLHRQVQIETPLRLNDFPSANITRGPRNRAADLGIVESGGKIERVREKGIAQEHA